MNVGEWLAKFKPQREPSSYKRPHDNMDMIEIAPECYLNQVAYEAGYDEPRVRAVSGEVVQNVPIGNSITPWRTWCKNELNGVDGWERKWSWL